jgi:hypothetical protein
MLSQENRLQYAAPNRLYNRETESTKYQYQHIDR